MAEKHVYTVISPQRRELAVQRLARAGGAVAAVLALLAALGLGAFRLKAFSSRDVTPWYSDTEEHYKYGSIGSEESLGIPQPIFEILPILFEDLLPQAPGKGYERLGFLYEPGRRLPVGISVRQRPFPLVGLNCAACHTGTLRRAAGDRPQLLPGAPANRFNGGGFLQFLIEIEGDPRLEADQLLSAIEQHGGGLSRADRLLYRWFIIPEMRRRLAELRRSYAWLLRHPAPGPGRMDVVTPHKVLMGRGMAGDDTIGTADAPPLFNQRARKGMALHWDGNNDSGGESIRSAALSAGARPDSLDLRSLERIEEWLQDLQPPVFPRERIDLARARRGQEVWERACADCHAPGGKRVGRITRLEDVGTDPERLASFNEGLAQELNALGAGRPWRFSHFKRTDGYANVPLDGVWARSPYLHNGSVPSLRALLFPSERPEVFYRGHDVFDWEKVGYVSSGPDAEREGFRFDTRLRGNGHQGHTYGAELPPAEREDLLEYLKTL